jgi:hypothetical protein
VIGVEAMAKTVVGADERDAARHASAKIVAGLAEDDHRPAGHVLAPVISDTLDDRGRAAVAHSEALACAAGDEHSAASGAIERGVADGDVA